MRLTAFLFLTLILPGPLAAQAGSGESPPARAGATAAGVLKFSRVAGADRVFVGAWAGLVFGDRLVLGGEGLTLTNSVALAGSEGTSGFDLGMGYGGLTVRYWLPLNERWTSEVALLLGAGHGVVKNRVTGREEGADNFAVAEPELSLFVTTLPWLHLGVSAGYRMAWGVQDLPLVAVEELRSFSASLSLRVSGR